MMPKKRRNFSGRFVAEDLRQGVWRLQQRTPHRIELILQGATIEASQLFAPGEISSPCIQWRQGSVLLTFTAADGSHDLIAAAAAVHEPLDQLYDELPLATFEPKARRFWRRVFFLLHIPGGRRLLKILARRG